MLPSLFAVDSRNERGLVHRDSVGLIAVGARAKERDFDAFPTVLLRDQPF